MTGGFFSDRAASSAPSPFFPHQDLALLALLSFPQFRVCGLQERR